MGQGKVYIPWNYSCTISCVLKILLANLKYLYVSMLESQSWKNKIVTIMLRLKEWWYLSKCLTIAITSFNVFNCPVKLKSNLKLKFRSKFNRSFTNPGYLHSAVWKALYNFKIKRAQQPRPIFLSNCSK